MSFFKLLQDRVYIILGNLLPLAGYFFLDWGFREIFLFYIAEVCIVEIFMGGQAFRFFVE
jgi:hypothetical protein